jgi:type IV secretion system protein VirB10
MATAKDMLSATASPNKLFGGRRPNDIPIYIIAGIVAVFLIIIATAAAGRSQTSVQEAKKEENNANADAMRFATSIVANNVSGIVPPEEEAPPIPIAKPDEGPPLLASTAVSPVAPWAQGAGGSGNGQIGNNISPPHDDSSDPRMQAVLRAASAKTNVQGADSRASGRSTAMSMHNANLAALQNGGRNGTMTDRDEMIKNRLNMVKEVMGDLPGMGGVGGSRGSSAEGGGYAQFDNTRKIDRWELKEDTQKPRTEFEIRSGSVIPAVLITGINSDIPGSITAQVSMNVYDTATGHHILIPQGSKLMGTYDNAVIFGQSRVLVAWQRIVFPDGKALDIGAMPGSDGVGYAGFGDKVNNHYIRTFASALMMSFITAGVSMSQDDRTSVDGRKTASSAMSEALGQQLGQVSSQVIQKHMNVSPTLEIRPGFIFNVVATKDITLLKPYQPFDYQRQAAAQLQLDPEEE